MLISLIEYAKKQGRSPVSVRQMALRGGFKTAQKIGRDWLIDSEEVYPDRRKESKKSKTTKENKNGK